MTKESKQMLIKNRITTTSRIKETSIEIAVYEKYSDGTSQHRQRKQ